MARSIAFREALREAMNEEMRRDDKVFLMGEEVAEYNGAYKVSQGMLAEFGPNRVIDTPISELGFAAVGVGAAQNGLRPIVEFMTWNFAVLALDQILNTASKMLAMSGGQVSCPIVFRGPNGSAGQLGAQHSTAFESLYANIPGIKVVSPSNGADAKGLLKQAIRYEEDPVIFMESEVMYGDKSDVPSEEYYIPLGKADIKRPGRDVTIVSFPTPLSPVIRILASVGATFSMVSLIFLIGADSPIISCTLLTFLFSDLVSVTSELRSSALRIVISNLFRSGGLDI